MKPDKIFLEALLRQTEIRFGRTPRSPFDFQELAFDIQSVTGRTIGLSTLKRIWGYVNDQSGTTFTTLSLLCRYIGYNDWDAFCRSTADNHKSKESAFSSDKILNTKKLPVDTIIKIELGEAKNCVIIKSGEPDSFTVVEAENIKLIVSDRLIVDCIAIGRPFFASECWRDGRQMGSYTGAIDKGVLKIVIQKPSHKV